MHPAARLFERALQEKLADFRKQAFVPADPGQAAGPTGAPPGGAPMDPMAGGAPPMDPMAGGAPPMDPMMGGAPPMDPMMGGAPPMDPAMMDPAMMGAPMDPMMGGAPPAEGGEGLTAEDADIVDKVTQRTMNIVRETLEMVGKAKPVQPAEPVEATAPAPESVPGPVTGQPGFDPAMFGQLGSAKTASAISRGLLKHLSR